jgi:nitroimidazol reductase NimA-like FMN-containing flavoprotein (pyridoxamine 5'-phosphate oxidase superfamily)
MTGTRTAVLGYPASDGRPLVAPIWFLVEGGQLVFNTGRDTAKGRALARDPRVAMCVDGATGLPASSSYASGRRRSSRRSTSRRTASRHNSR